MRTVNSYLAPCSLKKWHNDIHSSNLSFLCLEKMGMRLRMKLISVSRARIEKKCKFDFNPTTFKVELSSSDMGQAKNTQKK